jgi:TRAP-type C4-dicarboxylate transport system substrate-binding protein
MKSRGGTLMSKYPGRWFVVLAICVALAGVALVHFGERDAEAQIVARLGSLFPATNFDSLANVRLAEMIAQKTAGKIKVELFPAS